MAIPSKREFKQRIMQVAELTSEEKENIRKTLVSIDDIINKYVETAEDYEGVVQNQGFIDELFEKEDYITFDQYLQELNVKKESFIFKMMKEGESEEESFERTHNIPIPKYLLELATQKNKLLSDNLYSAYVEQHNIDNKEIREMTIGSAICDLLIGLITPPFALCKYMFSPIHKELDSQMKQRNPTGENTNEKYSAILILTQMSANTNALRYLAKYEEMRKEYITGKLENK